MWSSWGEHRRTESCRAHPWGTHRTLQSIRELRRAFEDPRREATLLCRSRRRGSEGVRQAMCGADRSFCYRSFRVPGGRSTPLVRSSVYGAAPRPLWRTQPNRSDAGLPASLRAGVGVRGQSTRASVSRENEGLTMRRTEFSLMVPLAPVAMAQEGGSYKIEESVCNAADHPARGVVLSLSSLPVRLDALGAGVLGTKLQSASFRLDAGFAAAYPPPGEVLGLRFANPGTLVWVSEKSIGGYNVYRDPLDLPAGREYGHRPHRHLPQRPFRRSVDTSRGKRLVLPRDGGEPPLKRGRSGPKVPARSGRIHSRVRARGESDEASTSGSQERL